MRLLLAVALLLVACGSTTGGPPQQVMTPSSGKQINVTGTGQSGAASASQVTQLLQRPATAPTLLENLKVVWDKRLLLQPQFYDDSNLLRCFGGSSVRWVKRDGQNAPAINDGKSATDNEPTVSVRRAHATVSSTAFPAATIEVDRLHIEESASVVAGKHLRAYTEDKAQLVVHAATIQGLTWGAVKRAFGAGAEDAGLMIVYNAGTDRGRSQMGTGSGQEKVAPHPKAFMRYLYPGEDPSQFGAADLPLAGFLIVQGPEAASPAPQDSDTVTYIRLFESVRTE